MPKQQTQKVIEKQEIVEDLDRWRGESPAAGRVATMAENETWGIGKGLKTVSDYKSTLEQKVRRSPGSSILLAGACGALLGFFLMRTGSGRGR
jgi:hypothetical protein